MKVASQEEVDILTALVEMVWYGVIIFEATDAFEQASRHETESRKPMLIIKPLDEKVSFLFLINVFKAHQI